MDLAAPTWTTIANPGGSHIVIDPSDPQTVYVGVHRTRDGGSTWQDLGLATNAGELNPLATVLHRRDSSGQAQLAVCRD